MQDLLGVTIPMSDGVNVSVRVYLPDGPGPFPTLFAASPYRYDNDDVPPTMVFFWHEVGPIHWYVARGYAYVHLDVRGTGRSEGEYGFLDRRERRDLYEVIEWIAHQPWSSGKVGGIGQSYYAASQWCMAAERPPHLTCIAPYDGHIDKYRGWFYPGGIRGNFLQVWWNGSVRLANGAPFNGQFPRRIRYDLCDDVMAHPLHDEWWDERSIDDALRMVDIPVYSVGAWVKRDLHLDGNVRGYHLVNGPKKLAFSDARTLPQTLAEFASPAFHERVLIPFYDHYLKGEVTEYLDRANVEYIVTGAGSDGRILSATCWPPEGIEYQTLFLSSGLSGTLTSLNDGRLVETADREGGEDSFDYPDSQWAVGPVAFGPTGPDAIRRVMTYVSEPLESDLLVAGTPRLTLNLSSTRTDAVVIAKLAVQFPQSEEERQKGQQPRAEVISKGWLRASHRATDAGQSVAGEPYHSHRKEELLVPGSIYELQLEMTNLAHRLTPGSRVRLELTCADSTITDAQFTHAYTPDMVGRDTYHRGGDHASRLSIPVLKEKR
jgi:putative CocE/NonD family hydrolase